MRNRTTKSITARLRTLGAAPANVLQPKHSILSADPTRTTLIRQSFSSHIKQVFDSLKVEILKRIGDEDWLGLTQASHEVTPALNAFCPTGEGGGQDNSCSSKSTEEYDEYGERVIKSEELTKGEVKGRDDYRSSGTFYDMQSVARGSPTEEYKYGTQSERDRTKQSMANLDSAIHKSKTSEDLTVYRGVAFNSLMELEYQPGFKGKETIHDLGYVSTSLDPDVAGQFASLSFLSTTAVIEIKVPKGTNCLKMPKDPKGKFNEAEVLLGRGSKFKITDVKEIKRDDPKVHSYRVKAEWVGEEPLNVSLPTSNAARSRNWPADRFVWSPGDWSVVDGSDYSPFVTNGEVGYFPPPPTMLDWVADVRQRDHFSCGAASVKAVADGLISQGVLPEEARQTLEETKRELGTDVEESTRPEAIVDYFAARGLGVETFSYGNLSTLDDYLQRGWPVITPVQDYGPEVPRAAVYDYGHYLTVIGHGLGYVFSQDSSEDNVVAGGDNKELSETGSIQKPGRIMIADEDFLTVWHDKDVDGKPYVRYGIAVGSRVATNANPEGCNQYKSCAARPTTEQINKAVDRDKWGPYRNHTYELQLVDTSSAVPTHGLSFQDSIAYHKERFQKGEPVEPVVLGEDSGVVDGHHRLEAAKQAGVEKIWALIRRPPTTTNSNPEGCNQYTGPGCSLTKTELEKVSEWREHLWNRSTVAKLAKRTVGGGDLSHLHPGEIVVYRGRSAGSLGSGPKSYTKSRAVAEKLAEGGRVEERKLTKDDAALDIEKALKGVPSKSEYEQEVFVANENSQGCNQYTGPNCSVPHEGKLSKFGKLYSRFMDHPGLRSLKGAGDFCKKKTVDLYNGMTKRYGKATAVAVLASAQVIGWGALGVGAAIGVPLYLPGVSLWGTLPALAVAESVKQVSGGVKKLKHTLVGNADTQGLAKEFVRELEAAYVDYLRKHRGEIEFANERLAALEDEDLLLRKGSGGEDLTGNANPYRDEKGRFASQFTKEELESLDRQDTLTHRPDRHTYAFAHEAPADKLPLGTTIHYGVGPKYVLTEVSVGKLKNSERDPLSKRYPGSRATAERFAERMKAGDDFPAPLVHINHKGEHVIYEGHKRVAAKKINETKTMRVWLADDREPVTNTRWQFHTAHQKVLQFQTWLKSQIKSKITSANEEALWKQYIERGYKKGTARAFVDSNKSKNATKSGWYKDKKGKLRFVPVDTTDFYKGKREQFLSSSFNHPVSIDTLKQLVSRTYTDLEGVTEVMAHHMRRTLADGLTQGKGARAIANDLAENVDGIGKKRALLIARTELVRAHAEGQLDGMERLGVTHVGAAVEWSTSGLNTVDKKGNLLSPCKLCKPLQGVVLRISEARGLIPRHVSCLCAWTPANVGEDEGDQIRDKEGIDSALEESGLDDVDISPSRPHSIFNRLTPFLEGLTDNEHQRSSYFADCPRDELGHCLPQGSKYVSSREELAKARKVALDKAANNPKPTKQELRENIAGVKKLGAQKFRRNLVGNSTDRAKRRAKLFEEFGDGHSCPCVYCGLRLKEGTLTQDKIITTEEGGRYRMPNIVPACDGCNKARGDTPWNAIKWS